MFREPRVDNSSSKAKIKRDCTDSNSSDRCLRQSAKKKQEYLAEMFLGLGATDIEQAFISAAESGSKHLLNLLLDRVDETTIETAMAHACRKGHGKIALKLYKLSPTQEALDQALQMSCLGGKEELVRWCLDNGATIPEDISWLIGKNLEKIIHIFGVENLEIGSVYCAASFGSKTDLKDSLSYYGEVPHPHRKAISNSALMNGNVENYERLRKLWKLRDNNKEEINNCLSYAVLGRSLKWVEIFLEKANETNQAACLAAANGNLDFCELIDSRGQITEEVVGYCGYSGSKDVITYFTDASTREYRLQLSYGCAAGGNVDYLFKYFPKDYTDRELKRLLEEAVAHSRLNVLREVTKRFPVSKSTLPDDNCKSGFRYLTEQYKPHVNISNFLGKIRSSL